MTDEKPNTETEEPVEGATPESTPPADEATDPAAPGAPEDSISPEMREFMDAQDAQWSSTVDGATQRARESLAE